MIINESVVNKIIEIISPLIHDEFGRIEEDDDYSFDDAYWIQEELIEHGIDAEVLNGVSKCAILCPDMGDVVLKIPFNGWYHVDMDTGELIWYPFEESEDDTRCDYCAAEYCKYEELASKGLECFVAETMIYKSENNHSFYLQEYVTPFYLDEDTHPTSPQTKEIVETLKVDAEMVDSEWFANCVEYYGKKKVESFFNYCKTTDSTILSDTHSGNFGYRKNGTPALLDFSGWYDY